MVALNVGQDFKKRWLNSPEAVRHAYQQDLARICDLLEPQTPIQLWVLNDEKAQLESQQNIEQAYADLKAELIEQARIRRQLALEKSLADKRAMEAAYAAELQADEVRKRLDITDLVHAAKYSFQISTITQLSVDYLLLPLVSVMAILYLQQVYLQQILLAQLV